jgi:beta-lactamase class A
MPVTTSRRALLIGTLLAAPAFAQDAETRLAGLERANGGRLGVAALDLGTGRRISHRADERFALCSTFKFLAASLVLARVDRGQEKLHRRVVFTEKDLVSYSPATKEHVGAGMTLAEI